MANEKRLIDANELTERIKSYAGMFTDELGFVVSLEAVLGGIEFSSTVDAVEVVRCKDCKYGIWDEEEGLWKCVYDADFDEQYGEYFGFTEHNDGLHFCSYGERREG